MIVWSYYGGKSKVVNLYPKPLYDKIIEPFAGAAWYSLKYFDRDILLVDKYEVIVKMWQWLQKCSRKDILGLPRLKFGENVDQFKWDCDEAKWLVGMIITGAATQPKKTAGRWKTIDRPNTQNYKLNFIADNLSKIKHWNIKLGSYMEIENETATWFIDPPYQHGGEYYVKSNRDIDYAELAGWCKSRQGQVIACENTKGTWLSFNPMSKMRGSRFNTTESIWSNLPTVFDMRQTKMELA